MNPQPTKRLTQLDVLRGIAILLVLGAHPVSKVDEAGWLGPLAYSWGHAGWTGVNLFFVLSGFLVGGLLFAELRGTGDLKPGRFMIRRMFKIWPSYYAYLLIVALMIVRAGLDYRALGPFLLHVQNYFEVPVGDSGGLASSHGAAWRMVDPDFGIWSFAPHTWSLAVEEHFYVLLPLLLSRVRSAHGLSFWLSLCLVGCAMSRAGAGVGLPTVPTHHNLDSLAFGVLLAYLFHFRPVVFETLSRRPLVLFPVGIALVVTGLLFGREASTASAIVPILLYVGYGLVLVAMMGFASRGSSARVFGSWPARLLALVGVYSYSIYLWHIDFAYRIVDSLMRAGFLADAVPSVQWLIFMAGYVFAAVAFGVLFGRCIERPALALRDRLLPRPEVATKIAAREGESTGQPPSVGPGPPGTAARHPELQGLC
jgi:peptidoglycan/LPS O-acetylase OafA/YrhL